LYNRTGQTGAKSMNENKEILLSICIPTHNRGSFLRKTLDTIMPQCNDAIEVVILDSASTDDTREVVNAYEGKIHNLTYVYSKEKSGIDIDMARTVALATGKYCWLMSSDDAMTSDAVSLLMQELKVGYELYICNRIVCDAFLNPIRHRRWLRKNVSKTVFNLSNRQELFSYLDAAIEFGAVFSYMSVLIFKREEWNRIPYDPSFTGTGYAHVKRIFGIITNHGKLKYIELPLVLNRSFNDSFLEIGIVNRFMLDIDGYIQLSDSVFPNDPLLAKGILRVMILEHPWYQVVKLRAFVEDEQQWRTIKKKLVYCGYHEDFINIVGFLRKIKPLIKIAVRLRHDYNRSVWHKHLFSLKHYIKSLARSTS